MLVDVFDCQVVLEKFGFDDNFIRWVKILHDNMESCVMNDGFSTGYFKLQRGTRQGDPLASYLFILSIEVLATMVRNDTNIEGNGRKPLYSH